MVLPTGTEYSPISSSTGAANKVRRSSACTRQAARRIWIELRLLTFITVSLRRHACSRLPRQKANRRTDIAGFHGYQTYGDKPAKIKREGGPSEPPSQRS